MFKNKKGFTLIELLVVISIISFLSSIVLASLNTAREKGRIAAGQQFAATIYHSTGDQLVGQWNFDGNLKDSSGLSNDGSGGSGIYENGISGQAIKLSPTQAVSINYNTAFDSSDLTISLWIKPNSINNSGCGYYACNGIMARENYTSSGFRFGYDSYGTPNFWTSENGGTFNITSSKKISVGKFYNIAITYNSTTHSGSMYLDGQLVGSATGNYINDTSQGIQINNGAINNYSGDNSFDEVRYYTKSLTAMEIEKIYAEGKNKFLAKR